MVKPIDTNEQAGKNFAWLSLAQIGTRVLGAAFFLFLTYKLKDSGIGVYSFISSFVPFWFIIIDFGGGEYLYREWARGKSRDTIEHDFFVIFTARLILLCLTLVPFVLVNFFINREILLPLLVFYFAMFLSMFIHLAELYLQSINAFRYVAIRQVLEKTVAILAGVALLLGYASVTMVFLAVLISQIFSIAYYYSFKIIPFRFKLVVDFARIKQLFFRGLPFLFIGIFAALYARIDMTMLRFFKDFEAVGWYGTAYKFIEVTYLFPSLFITAVFPLLSAMSVQEEKKSEFKDFLQRNVRILFAGSLLVASFFIFFAPHFIGWFFPASFSPSVLALRILMIGQALSFMSAFFSSLLLIQRREKIGLRIIICCAVLNIALNFLFIPKYSLYGAAWATTISEGLNLFLLQHYCQWDKHWGGIIKMSALFCANAALLLFLKSIGQLNNIWLGTAVVLTNIAVLFILKLLGKQDVLLFINPYIGKFKSLTIGKSE